MSRFGRLAITLLLAVGVLIGTGGLLFVKTFYPDGIGGVVWKWFFLVVVPVILLGGLLLFDKHKKK